MNFKDTHDLNNGMVAWPKDTDTTPVTRNNTSKVNLILSDEPYSIDEIISASVPKSVFSEVSLAPSSYVYVEGEQKNYATLEADNTALKAEVAELKEKLDYAALIFPNHPAFKYEDDK